MDIPFDKEDSCPCCPHDYGNIGHTSPNLVLRKLCLLIDDSEARNVAHRHIRLIYHYLGLSKDGLHLADVPYVIVLLEFLCEKLSEVEEYSKPLSCLVALCQCPPLVHKPSESLYAPSILSDFYSGLGNCIIYLQDVNQQLSIIEIIHNFLTFDDDMDPRYVSLSKRTEAMQRTKLTCKLGHILQTSPCEVYNQLLDLILQVTLISDKCIQDLLNSNCLQFLINRISLEETDPLKTSYTQEHTRFIMWQLLKSVPPTYFENMVPLPLECLVKLRKWLRKEATKGRPHIRNDILALICQIVDVFPCIDIVQSGLVEDICLLAVATEFGVEGTWADNINLSSTTSDFEFKKLLLTVLCSLLKYSPAILIFKEHIIMESIANLIYPCNNLKFPWKSAQTLELLTLVLHCLPLFAESMPGEFRKTDISLRLMHLIKHFSEEVYNLDILRCCLHCFYSLSLHDGFIDTFRNCLAIQVLTKVLTILIQEPFAFLLQQTLSYCLLIVGTLEKGKDVTDVQIVNFSLALLKRLLVPNENDFKIDHCLRISLGVLIWDLIAPNENNRKEFINNGGAFLIIDTIYISIYSVQMVYLGLLVDMTDDGSMAQLITWRGKKKGENLISFLCDLWRKQEEMNRVSRDTHGCILDIERPLMGQQLQTLLSKKSNLALLDMNCCLRPKIYAIITLIINRHKFAALVLKNSYGIPYDAEFIKDKVCWKIVEFYECLKEGEIWWELWKPVQRNQGTLLPMSATFKHYFSMKYIQWASQIHREQKDMNKSLWKQVLADEENLYSQLKLCRLSNALTALRELEYELRVSDHKKLAEAKSEQIDQIFNEGCISKLDDEKKDIIYLHETNVTTIKSGRDCLLTSIKGPRKLMELKEATSMKKGSNVSYNI